MSTHDSDQVLALPPGFKTITEIRDLPNEQLIRKVMVSLIGIVKDFMPPTDTKGSDCKCSIELMDHSVLNESYGIKIAVFRKKEEREQMPKISGPGDMVLIRNAKAQMWGGAVSLLTTWATECHVLSASQISNASFTASKAQWQCFPPKFKAPSVAETEYAIWTKGHSDELDLPSDTEFHEKSFQATKVNDKFSLLKDVKPDRFYNIIGQVIKVHDRGDLLSLYLSDYTANTDFYNNTWCPGGATAEGRDGDEYGYTKARPKDAKDWPGPFGKMSMQLSLYDEHADFVREQVKVQNWLLLSNLQIKYGKMGGCLEGYMRGDRQRFEGRLQVKVFEQSQEPEGNDPRWVECLRRCREYWKKHEAQKKALLNENDALGNKRKVDDSGEPKLNSKQRRNQKRAAGESKVIASEAKVAEKLNLNSNIRCSFPDKPCVSLKEILEPEKLMQLSGPDCPSPFTVRKYRANVRIVNYAPETIEDFSVWRRESEYDILSDYSGGEDTDVEEDMRSYSAGKGFAKKIWEWRFWLQVEEAGSSASSKGTKERLWLLVDNSTAQGLLGLEDDAANLRKDSDLLDRLKEQLFKLWGDLEEQKTAILKAQSKKKDTPPPSSFDLSMKTLPRIGEQPDLDSGSEDEVSMAKASRSISENVTNGSGALVPPGVATSDHVDGTLKPKNKAFTCCIQQYGVKIREEDPLKADAGEGRRWQRVFALFGTSIT